MSKEGVKVSSGGKKTALFFAAAAIVAVLGLIVFYVFFSPKALYKRSLIKGVRAFEQKNEKRFADLISARYTDPGGNTMMELLNAAAALNARYDKNKVVFSEIDVELLGRNTARLKVSATIYCKSGKETYRMKSDEPMEILMAREQDGRRRIISINGLDFSIKNVGESIF